MGWNVFREENGILLLASNSTQYPVLDQFPDLHWEPPDRLMNGATYHSKSVTLYWSDDLSATPIEEVDTFNSGKLVSTPSGGGMTDESLQIRYSYSAKARGVNPWRFIHYQSRSMEISRKEAFSLLKTWGIEVPSR